MQCCLGCKACRLGPAKQHCLLSFLSCWFHAQGKSVAASTKGGGTLIVFLDWMGRPSMENAMMFPSWLVFNYVMCESCWWRTAVPWGLMPLNIKVLAIFLWQCMPAWKDKQEVDIQCAGGRWCRENNSSSRYMKSAEGLGLPFAFSAFLEDCPAGLW